MGVFGRRRDRAWKRALLVECEAFLSGHYANYLSDDWRPVPGWAWLNALAHCGEDDIRDIASGVVRGRSSHDDAWRLAVGFLAEELVTEAARQGCTVGHLQRSALVPLELDLARETLPDMRPAQLIGVVLTAISAHPTSWSV